jgi:hypothetical protein
MWNYCNYNKTHYRFLNAFFADRFTYGLYHPHTILDLLRIKFLSALRSYTFTSPYTLHNFVAEKFLMTLPYRRIYVKKTVYI